MRELVLTCAMAILGAGCVDVVSHADEYDAGPPPKPADAAREAEVISGACQSAQYWTGGNSPNSAMSPGLPCIAGGCHSATSQTPMTLGGTVYPTKGDHDDNDCNGIDGAGMALAIMDPDTGMDLFARVLVNSAGNFYSGKMLPSNGFKVKVVYMGREAIMNATVTDGNCNSCHTAGGLGLAKGRIIPLAPGAP